MWIRSVATVVFSVVLSVLVTLVVDRNIKREASDTVRARKIELVDNQGKLRGAFRMSQAAPELVLFDDEGQEQTDLGSTGIAFNSYEPSNSYYGIVTLGRLALSDFPPDDPFMTGWGLRVANRNGNATVMGVSNNGKLWAPSIDPKPTITR